MQRTGGRKRNPLYNNLSVNRIKICRWSACDFFRQTSQSPKFWKRRRFPSQ